MVAVRKEKAQAWEEAGEAEGSAGVEEPAAQEGHAYALNADTKYLTGLDCPALR